MGRPVHLMRRGRAVGLLRVSLREGKGRKGRNELLEMMDAEGVGVRALAVKALLYTWSRDAVSFVKAEVVGEGGRKTDPGHSRLEVGSSDEEIGRLIGRSGGVLLPSHCARVL